MLRVFASNRLEALAEVFLARFDDAAHTGSDPLRPIDVVVPSMGTGQWLRHGMAEALGIAAQFDVQLPASFAWQVFRAFDPSLPGESEYALERCKRSKQHPLSLDVFALVCEGQSQIVRTPQRVRMLGPKHVLVHLKHLALDPLSVGVFALA